MPNPTENLVSGLKFRMTAQELREHLRARSVYHKSRHEEKSQLLPQLEDTVTKLKAQPPAQSVQHFNKSGSTNYQFNGDDAITELKRDIETHHNKSIAFAWLAEHVLESDYLLDSSDFVRLEIFKSVF
jgi:hypothetical protein